MSTLKINVTNTFASSCKKMFTARNNLSKPFATVASVVLPVLGQDPPNKNKLKYH